MPMDLEQRSENIRAASEAGTLADGAAFIDARIEDMMAGFDFSGARRMGEKAPDIRLPDAAGKIVSLRERLVSDPVVLTFYRGGWCSHCNGRLAAYQRASAAITEAGGQLIAVSPQASDGSLTTMEKNELTFDVLSDAGNKAARDYGLVYRLQPAFRATMAALGIDLAAINGDGSGELPVPATFVISRDGRIALAFAEADFRKRPAPKIVIETLDALSRTAA